MKRLIADPSRETWPETGIVVRACFPNGNFYAADIAHLDTESLLAWLHRDGGDNPLAENTVLILLGHKPDC
jgi:hypothetical protein